MDELEIIRLLKKALRQAGTKAGVKTVAKILRMGYYIFLREYLERTTGKDQKNYCNTVTGSWKKIKKKTNQNMSRKTPRGLMRLRQ